MKTRIFLTLLAMMAFTVAANAQNTGADKSAPANTPTGVEYVDANNNGICDNFENGTSNIQTGQRNWQFRGQAPGVGAGWGPGNRPGVGWGQGRGPGAGWGPAMRQGFGPGQGRGPVGMGRGRGMGRFYVDANNNGICDYFEQPVNK
jgi:hypothetical protein